MLKINQVKLPAGHSKKELETKIRKILRLSAKDELTYQITRRSIDARKKPEIYYVYTIEARVQKESAVIKMLRYFSSSTKILSSSIFSSLVSIVLVSNM